MFPFVEAQFFFVSRHVLEDFLDEDVERLVDLRLWRRRNRLLQVLELIDSFELDGLHGEDGARDVRLEVFLCDF